MVCVSRPFALASPVPFRVQRSCSSGVVDATLGGIVKLRREGYGRGTPTRQEEEGKNGGERRKQLSAS